MSETKKPLGETVAAPRLTQESLPDLPLAQGRVLAQTAVRKMLEGAEAVLPDAAGDPPQAAPMESPHAPVSPARALNVTQVQTNRQQGSDGAVSQTHVAGVPDHSASDVIAVGDQQVPPELASGIDRTREGFVGWQKAIALRDTDGMVAAEQQFSEGVGAVRRWLEQQNLLNCPLSDEERIDLIARVVFGKAATAVRGSDRKILEAFETVQMLENPSGKFGAPMAALAKRMEELDICFASPDSQWLLLRLLEIDLWGARDASRLMAEIATTMGYETRDSQTLGAGANGGVVHLKRESLGHVLPSGSLVGPDDEIAAKFPTNGRLISQEVARSQRASEAGVGPRCLPSDRDDIALFMVFEKGAQEMESYMQNHPFDLELVRALAQQMRRLHAAGLVHRDLKPANILVRPGGKEALFIDFGLSEDMPENGFGKDDAGMIRGSPLYLPLEGLRSEGWGPQTDIFALGCIVFEWATGRVWMEHVAQAARENGQTIYGVMAAHAKIGDDPELFRDALSILDDRPALRDVLARLLAPNRGDRRSVEGEVIRVSTAEEAAHLLARLKPEDVVTETV
jgi:hypothetical protein